MSPKDIVEEAKRRGLDSISFTYTEPTIFYEYIYDISKLAKKRGIKTSIVSNGYINPQPLRKLLSVLDVVKIDLKAFTEGFYQKICSATLKPVLETLKILKEEDTFFEIVNLIIPSLNDSPKEIKEMCKWIRENLGKDVPLHFTRFMPAYKMLNLPPTPIKTLEDAIKIAKEMGLRYVYIGNVPGHKYNSTFCPKCKKRVIHRVHFTVLKNEIKGGRCKFCGYKIPGVWE
jgi:pyruvate formate lyase activating enzyme